MNSFYPLNIRLSGKRIVIVGGGKMAERKVRSLCTAGAFLEVVSPDLTVGLQGMLEKSLFVWKQKTFSQEDIVDAFMIIAATNNATVNRLVKDYASNNQLVCLLDQQQQSDVHFPAIVKRGKLTIATSTSGASPVLAKKISRRFSNEFDDRYIEYLDFLAEARRLILEYVEDMETRRELLTEIVSQSFLDSRQRLADFQNLLIERNIQLPI
ncbi:NAD(P)-binding protein [Bacillus marasmi]|uniref:NAD(P)-binding protein n=1 Tax=Bacillus marasmi TaxID=1926279 RepID=UPI0011CA71D6|nr:NAD(P)-binding protein [Bacillus marasmi]